MFCQNCGAQMNAGDRTCKRCGAPVRQAANQYQNYAQPAEGYHREEHVSTGGWIGINFLMLIPIVIGGVLQRNTTGDTVDYTQAMWIFTGIGIAAIIVSVMLLIIDRRKNYGLQKANINDK